MSPSRNSGLLDEMSPVAEHAGLVPPSDGVAEQSVLGAMLLSKDAVADVLEKLHVDDFYKPKHQNIYDAILDLYGRGEPADAVTVAAELDRRGLLLRVGGAPYLHTLIATVPTAASAGYYAGIVADKAILRRLVAAGTRVVQYGYTGADGADVAEVVDRAQAEIYEATSTRRSEDFSSLEEVLQGTLDELDDIASRGGLAAQGVPTGFLDLDELTNGLQAGQMITVAARPGVGKALALNTNLPTPTGWTTMGAVAVGDRLLGADGKTTTVVAATEVLLGRPCYEVHFNDGTCIVADAEHQWPTGRGTLTTVDLIAGDQLPKVGAVELDAATGYTDTPHRVGRWLAGDPAVILGAEQAIWGYLRGSGNQRTEMLRGILEAAVEVVGGQGDSFTVTCQWRLAEHRALAIELLNTLGFVVAPGWQGEPITVLAAQRRVVKVQAQHSVAVRCVQVDNPDHVYLAGDTMVPTHNSTLGLDFMRSCSITHQMPSVIFSLEMTKIRDRDEAAIGRGQNQARRHAFWPDER